MAQLESPFAPAPEITRTRTPIASVARSVVWALVKWDGHRRSRTRLKELDDHMLRDIGVTRAAADKEAGRPFWQG